MEEGEGATGREACKTIPVTVLERDDMTIVKQQGAGALQRILSSQLSETRPQPVTERKHQQCISESPSQNRLWLLFKNQEAGDPTSLTDAESVSQGPACMFFTSSWGNFSAGDPPQIHDS